MDFVVDNDLANYDNSNSGFITATLTTEEVQDIVNGFGNTETVLQLHMMIQMKLDFIPAMPTFSEQVQDIVGLMFRQC